VDFKTPRQLISEAGFGILATEVAGQPRCRPMAFVVPCDRFVLWSSTWHCSGKVAEMKANPRVEVCFVGAGKVHLRVEGLARLDGNREKKARLLELNPRVRRHFFGPEDENFVHIEIVPTRVRWMPPGFGEYTLEEVPD